MDYVPLLMRDPARQRRVYDYRSEAFNNMALLADEGHMTYPRLFAAYAYFDHMLSSHVMTDQGDYAPRDFDTTFMYVGAVALLAIRLAMGGDETVSAACEAMVMSPGMLNIGEFKTRYPARFDAQRRRAHGRFYARLSRVKPVTLYDAMFGDMSPPFTWRKIRRYGLKHGPLPENIDVLIRVIAKPRALEASLLRLTGIGRQAIDWYWAKLREASRAS